MRHLLVLFLLSLTGCIAGGSAAGPAAFPGLDEAISSAVLAELSGSAAEMEADTSAWYWSLDLRGMGGAGAERLANRIRSRFPESSPDTARAMRQRVVRVGSVTGRGPDAEVEVSFALG